MTQSQFIENITHRLWVEDWYTKRFWSLYFNNGVLYSYGLHYPLLFVVKGKKFVNTKWYSNTTAKHIRTAYSIAGVWVKLSWVYGTPSLNQTQTSLLIEKNNLTKSIQELKRTGTQKEALLLGELERVNRTIDYIMA